MTGAARGILVLCVVYYLITGEWPEIPPEVIEQCLNRAEAPDGGEGKRP